MKRLIAFFLLVVWALSVVPQPVAADEQSDPADYISNELIVGIKPGLRGRVDVQSLARQVGAEVADVSFEQDAYLFRFTKPEQVEPAIAVLQAAPGVLYVERNGIMRVPPVPAAPPSKGNVNAQVLPNDSLRPYQWHLDKILYPLTSLPHPNPPCIVVLDTGVDYNHPDLFGKVYLGFDAFDNDYDPMDANGHGTHVAGIAAAKTNNLLGIAGISPNSNILAVRVLGPAGWGTFWMVGKGVQWANAATSTHCGGQNPRVYNMSLGSIYNSTFVSSQIANAAALGRLVVAAAGNSNTSTKHYPGADPNAFGVAATEENDRRTYFSNYDTAANPWVDIAAPGWSILSTVPGGYEKFAGTSMASPVVAGVAARVWAANPGWTAAQVRAQIQNTADPTQGFPRPIKRVNLYRALGGTVGFLQGRILDAMEGIPVNMATVTVSGPGGYSCTQTTGAGGYYTCSSLTSNGTYTVTVSASDRPTIARTFTVGSSLRLFNADVAMSRNFGSSGDWTITLLWRGWQPYETLGREFDLWLVDQETPTQCYAGWFSPMDQDDWRILIPRDSLPGQTEGAFIRKSYGGVLQVWIALWDESLFSWPSSNRVTGSGLEVRIYKNNTLVNKYTAPGNVSSPWPLSVQDNWYVGRINLDTGTWTNVNQIHTDSTLPSCVFVP